MRLEAWNDQHIVGIIIICWVNLNKRGTTVKSIIFNEVQKMTKGTRGLNVSSSFGGIHKGSSWA